MSMFIPSFSFGAIAAAIGKSAPSLVAIPDDNSVFNDEGDATTGWTASNATLSVASSYLRQTKTGAGTSSSMSKGITFTSTDRDFILYGKMRASSGTNHIGLMWLLNGSKEISLWFGSAAANTAYTAGAISMCGTTGASTRHVLSIATGVDYTTTAVEFALHFDKKFGSLACYFKTAGKWLLKGRVACDWFSAAQIQVLNTSNTPATGWTEFDHLSLCRPNIMSIGDSICEGKNFYSPNLGLGLTDGTNSWQYNCPIYPALRNTLIVNKGVGGQTSSQIHSRLAADVTNHSPRLVFLHASTNDEVGAISKATRTANIQADIAAINGAGAQCVLLNAMYGTSGAPDNTPTPDLRDYMLDWWTNYRPSLAGLPLAIDITVPIDSGGFANAAKVEADGLHPTASGYADIGAHIESFF